MPTANSSEEVSSSVVGVDRFLYPGNSTVDRLRIRWVSRYQVRIMPPVWLWVRVAIACTIAIVIWYFEARSPEPVYTNSYPGQSASRIAGWFMGVFLILTQAAKVWFFHRYTFDRQLGCYWQGLKRKQSSKRRKTEPLENILAFQWLISGDGRLTEVNLVLRDPPSTRIHLATVKNKVPLRHQFYMLADFLGKPLWESVAAPLGDPPAPRTVEY
jgi:hypothetical protein